MPTALRSPCTTAWPSWDAPTSVPPRSITKHFVRYSLSLRPKQAKGVTGEQGTSRAEPLALKPGNDTLTLRFDSKPCEMHVVGSMRKNVRKPLAAEPLTFYRNRPP